MTYHMYAGYCGDFVVATQWNGKKQFVVFAAVEGCRNEAHVEFFGHDGCLVVDGYAVFVDAATGMALPADVQQFRRKSVLNIHHGSRDDVVLSQLVDNVFSCFGFELAFENIFPAFESRCKIPFTCKYVFLPFEKLQSHVSCS